MADDALTAAVERGLRKCRVEDAPVPLIREHDLHHVTHMVMAEVAQVVREHTAAAETDDGMANDCTHGSASGIDTTPVNDPGKVWRCDHCGLRWRQDGRPLPEHTAAQVAAVKAEAWDEGYCRGTRDAEADLEPADNSYRAEWLDAEPAPDGGGDTRIEWRSDDGTVVATGVLGPAVPAVDPNDWIKTFTVSNPAPDGGERAAIAQTLGKGARGAAQGQSGPRVHDGGSTPERGAE